MRNPNLKTAKSLSDVELYARTAVFKLPESHKDILEQMQNIWLLQAVFTDDGYVVINNFNGEQLSALLERVDGRDKLILVKEDLDKLAPLVIEAVVTTEHNESTFMFTRSITMGGFGGFCSTSDSLNHVKGADCDVVFYANASEKEPLAIVQVKGNCGCTYDVVGLATEEESRTTYVSYCGG